MNRSARTLARALALAAFYAASFAVMTVPLVAHPRTSFIVDGPNPRLIGDPALFVWNVDTFARSVHAGRDPFFTARVLFPRGAGLWFHTYTPIIGLIGLWMRPIEALNLAVFASFVLSGLGGYAFSRLFVRDRRLSALSGFAFAFCPFKLAHLIGHYNLMLTATIAPFAWCVVSGCRLAKDGFDRAWLSRARGRILGAAALLFVTALSDYYYGYFLLWFAALYLAFFRFGDRLRFSRGAWRWFLPRVLLAVVASSALTALCVFVLGVDVHGGLGYSADLFGYLLPSASQRLLGGAVLSRLRQLLHIDGIEHETYLGWSLLLAAAYYFRRRLHRGADPATRALWLTGAGLLVLSMPTLRVAGAPLVCLPTALLHLVPGLNNLRVPARFNVMVMLLLPVAAALALDETVAKLSPARAWAALAAMLLALGADFDRAGYFVAKEVDIPRVYRVLAERPAGTLLELPFGVRDGYHELGLEVTAQMWFQTLHDKPIVGGMIARLPPESFAAERAMPVAGDLLGLLEDPPRPARPPAAAQVAEFIRSVELRYALVAPEEAGTPAEAYLLAALSPFIVKREAIDGYRLLTIAADPFGDGARRLHRAGPDPMLPR